MNSETPQPKKPFPYRWLLIFFGFSILSDIAKPVYKLVKNSGFMYTDQLFYGILIAIVVVLLIFKIRKRIQLAKQEKLINMIDQAIYEESKAGQEEKAAKGRREE